MAGPYAHRPTKLAFVRPRSSRNETRIRSKMFSGTSSLNASLYEINYAVTKLPYRAKIVLDLEPAHFAMIHAVPSSDLVALIAIFFLTSVVSVVTGSTSLVTVPVMISMGMDPRISIATNMLALTFMSVGGSLPFVRKGAVSRRQFPLSILLTVVGSAVGALVVLAVPVQRLQICLAVAMFAVAIFTLAKRDLVLATEQRPVSASAVFTGYAVTFLLAVYGGFFSGGYVTMLTAAFVILFGMTFLQAVATTKVVNVFSSSVATLVFFWRGVVDVRLGVILGVTMFLGALLGGRIALSLNVLWLRRIFIAVVFVLAMRMLWLLR
jgi:uncharacterized protein